MSSESGDYYVWDGNSEAIHTDIITHINEDLGEVAIYGNDFSVKQVVENRRRAIQGPTTADFPANRSKLSGYFNKGKQQYKNLKAKRAQRKQEHQARLVPEDKWWANAPSGKKLDLTDPTVKKILEEHNHWTLANAPETQPWRTRSKFIAEHLIHSKLVTKTEFLAAALAARRDAEAQFMSGKLTLGQLKETDLRNKLIAIIDKRVAKGDYWDLVASIAETLPGEFDYARNDPQANALAGFKDGVYEPPSARVVANSIWSRNNKPTVEELFSEAEAEIFSDMAEAHQEGESFSVVEALANMAGYLSERYRVEVTEDQLTDFIESSELVKGDLTEEEEAARIEDEEGLALEEERADDGGFGDYPDEDDFTVADFTVQGVIDRSDNPFFGHWVDNAKEWAAMLKENPVRAFSHLVRMADSELRSMGPIGLWIAQQFRAMPGQKEASDTVFRMVQMKAGPHHAALKVLLDSLESPRIGLWEGIFNKHPTNIMKAKRAHRDKVMEALLLQKKPAELSADIKSEVEAVRKYLKNLYDWYTGSTGTTFVINGVKMKGMNLKLTERGFKDEVSTYYPMMFDTLFLDKNRGKFEGIAKKYGFADEDATNMRVKLTRDEDGGLNNGFHTDAATDQFFGPGAAFTQQRVKEWPLEMRDELVREGFYHKDLSVTLTAYTEMMVRRAVWQRRFGETDFGPVNFARYKAAGIEDSIHSPVAKLLLKVEEGYKKGELIEWQYKRIINDILPAYAGQLGLRTNSKLRNISAGVTIYNNLRLLPFAIFAQYVDVGTMINRGDFKAFEASLQGMLNKSTREDVRTMLTVLGAIRDGVTEHALNDQALNTFMTGNAKRINDTFFRYNLMEGWTNGIRVMAAIAGREFIMRHSRLALREGNKKSQKYMDNLGLGDPEGLAAAAVWDGFTTDNEQISAGLLRYVDESMIRPDATIRPVHVSDPGYMIFNHLKGFLWNFHGTFIQHAVHEAKVHQNLLPLFTLGMMALPFAAVGYELRRWVTNFGEPPPRLEGASYMIELVERGGLLGPWQLVADMEQADAFGKPFVLGAAGPAAEQLFDFYDKDLAKWLPRALPVVASMPPLRRGMRDILSKE